MMQFSSTDRDVPLFHYDDNNEFTHAASMTVRAHMGLPAKCTLTSPPEHNSDIERCYFINDEWVKTELFIGRSFWDEQANQDIIHSYLQIMPEHYSLLEPPKATKGFVIRLVDGQWKQIEDHRDKTIYNCRDCTQSEVVEKIGSIKQGFTHDEPSTFYDEWINQAWVTNLRNKYIADFNDVDETRRGLYSYACDPLIAEANIKRLQGHDQEALDMETQALAARARIQVDHPWPESLI